MSFSGGGGDSIVNVTVDLSNIPNELPSQTGQAGKLLTTNGSSVNWGPSLPTDGSTPLAYTTTNTVSGRDYQFKLESNLIGNAIHYPIPIHHQPAYITKFGGYDRFPLTNTERQADQILSLPVHQNLNPEQLVRVCDVVNEFFGPDQ